MSERIKAADAIMVRAQHQLALGYSNLARAKAMLRQERVTPTKEIREQIGYALGYIDSAMGNVQVALATAAKAGEGK